jgi:hypothetical protein
MPGTYKLLYVGRKSSREQVLSHFSGAHALASVSSGEALSTVLAGDLPTPRALCVPRYVHAVAPLGRSIDEITAGYSDKLRRVIRQQLARCRVQQAVDDAEIDRTEREMLRPYAMARHGHIAAQMAPEEVRRMAHQHGRIDIVYSGDERVSCHLGFALTRGGKRYWNALRFGFTEAVFSNSKRLHEVNSINIHLAIEWAPEKGFDFYDLGYCAARPDDGLLKWKRRRGGHVDISFTYSYFYVRLSKAGSSRLLWNSPLFARERDSLTLHLGLPDASSDEEALVRRRSICITRADRMRSCSSRFATFSERSGPPLRIEDSAGDPMTSNCTHTEPQRTTAYAGPTVPMPSSRIRSHRP